jgi:hypothetical protein
MAGACVPLEVVGGIMSFAGSPPPAALTFTKRSYGGYTTWTIKVFPAFFELQKHPAYSGAKTERETWAHSNETTELVKAIVRTWLSADNFELHLKRGIFHEQVHVYSRDDFDGSWGMYEGEVHDWDQEEHKPEGHHYLRTPDEPLPKHFARLQQLHQQRREFQLATAHNIAAIFFAAPTHY